LAAMAAAAFLAAVAAAALDLIPKILKYFLKKNKKKQKVN